MGSCLDILTSPVCPVAVAIFLHSMFIVGTIKAIGILFEEMSTSLNTTVAEFGLSVGIFTLCTFCPAPIFTVMYKAKRVPRRIALLIGGCLACFGISLASLANSSGHVTVCLMCSGIGLCMLHVYLSLILNERAENFNLVFTVASSGYGLGMIIPPLVAQLLQTAYGWRGALLLLGALMMNIMPFLLAIRGKYYHPGYHGNGRVRRESSQMIDDDLQGTSRTTEPDKFEHESGGPVSTCELEIHTSNASDTTSDDSGALTRGITLQKMSMGAHLVKGDVNGSKKDRHHEDIGDHTDLGGEESYQGYQQSTSMSDEHYSTGSDVESDQIVSEIQTERTLLIGRSHSRKHEPSSSSPATTSSSATRDRHRGSHLRPRSHKLHSDEAKWGKQRATMKKNTTVDRADFRTVSEKIRDFFLNSPYYNDPWGNFVYLSKTVFGFIYSGWHGFLVPHALERGFTPYSILILTSIASVGIFSGRVSAGILTHRLISPASLFLLLCPVNILALLVYAHVPNIFAMVFMSLVSGVSIAGRTKLPTLAARSRAPPDRYFYVLPMGMLFLGFGTFLGGYVSGLVAAYFGSFDAIFNMLACVEVIVILTMLPVWLAKKPEY